MRAQRVKFGLLVSAMVLFADAAASACTKTVRWNDDPPYSMQKPDGEITGIVVEMMKRVLAELGCVVRFEKLPWARALSDLEHGRLDILPGALKTSAREKFARFAGPYSNSPNALFFRKGLENQGSIRHLADLKGLPFRLGVQINVVYSAEYERLLRDADFHQRLEVVSTRLSLWHMLKSKRVDGVLADESTGWYELSRLGYEGMVAPDALVISSQPVFVMLSRRSVTEEWAGKFDETLKNLMASGELKRMTDRFVGRPGGD